MNREGHDRKDCIAASNGKERQVREGDKDEEDRWSREGKDEHEKV